MAELRFGHVGMGNMVQVARVVAIINPHTATARRYVELARKRGTYIDCSTGRVIKAFLLLDEGSVMASCVKPATLVKRFYDDSDYMLSDEEKLDFDDTEGIGDEDNLSISEATEPAE